MLPTRGSRRHRRRRRGASRKSARPGNKREIAAARSSAVKEDAAAAVAVPRARSLESGRETRELPRKISSFMVPALRARNFIFPAPGPV